MAIILAGVTLNPSMPWVDRYEFSSVKQSAKRTLGGGLVLFNSSLVYGRAITLEGREDQGWMTFAMVNALQVLSDDSEAVYNLQIGSEVFTVMFRHSDPPAFSAKGLIERSVPLAGDMFTGVIKLITV